MAQKSPKFYAVWKGRTTGVFDTWESCKSQIDGFEGAQYKSFTNKNEAEIALSKNYFAFINKSSTQSVEKLIKIPFPTGEDLVVDAAWNTKSGDMEYQGVDLKTRKKLFHQGPFADGTNNIGEFLAIVHALALLTKHNSDLPIYTDSKTALSWIKLKRANTKLEKTPRNAELFEVVSRAEKWLQTNTFSNKVLKWETEQWGENLADFGRK